MTNIARIVVDVMDIIYIPMDIFVPIIFFYCTSFLRTLTVGVIGVLTIGKILSIKRKKIYNTYLLALLYLYYIGYTLHSFGVFTAFVSLNLLDWTTVWTTVVLTVVAPICMLILGKIIMTQRILDYKIFPYIVIMLIYLFIAWLWFLFLPETVNFIILFFVWVLALAIVGIISIKEHFQGGDKNE